MPDVLKVKMKKLWLDDLRPAPGEGWIEVSTAMEAIKALARQTFDLVSLDHDLGDHTYDGHLVAAFIEEEAFHGRMKSTCIQVHSANPVGAKRMLMCIEHAYRIWGRTDTPQWIDYMQLIRDPQAEVA